MFTFPIFRRQSDRPTTRRWRAHRRPLVESLEGRQLLSTFTPADTKKMVPAIQGSHRHERRRCPGRPHRHKRRPDDRGPAHRLIVSETNGQGRFSAGISIADSPDNIVGDDRIRHRLDFNARHRVRRESESAGRPDFVRTFYFQDRQP